MTDLDYYYEGRNARKNGESKDDNPYPHDGANWWFNEEWERGWEAERRAQNDDE